MKKVEVPEKSIDTLNDLISNFVPRNSEILKVDSKPFQWEAVKNWKFEDLQLVCGKRKIYTFKFTGNESFLAKEFKEQMKK